MTEKFNPLVSIVIPVYNGSNYMREAIDSALEQTYDNIEIIVVNDGSTDNTDEIAKSYDDKIRYFKKENGGVSTALNLAIENMRGEYFSWLSHDDKYLPEKIEVQINALRNLEDKTTVINCGYSWIDAKSNIISTHKLNIPEEYKFNPLYYVFTGKITGCGLLICRSHFENAGLFDIKQRITQDYDMWFKILRNANIFSTNEMLVEIRQHKNRITNISNSYNSESDDFWFRILSEITDYEIINNFKNKYNFYMILGLNSLVKGRVKTIEKIHDTYINESKKYPFFLKNFVNKYKIEKNYAYATNTFKTKSFFSLIIYIRHCIKKIILKRGCY